MEQFKYAKAIGMNITWSKYDCDPSS